MSTKPDSERGPPMDGIVEQFVDGMARSFTIGTDAGGYDHHYRRSADAVVVYKPHTRELDDYQPLDGGSLERYVTEFVEERRGWKSLHPQAPWLIEEEDSRREADE